MDKYGNESLWEHIESGKKYEIILVANADSDKWPTMIVYHNPDSDGTWSRPKDEWDNKFKFLCY